MLFLLPACGGSPASGRDAAPELDHADLDPVPLQGEIVYQGDRLALPREVQVVGEYLVVLDAAADSVVHVIRRSDGAHVRAFGPRGEGPGEFRGAWSVEPEPGTAGRFWVYDLALRRLTHVDLERDFVAGARPGQRSINLVADATVLDPVWLDSAVVAEGFFAQGRFGRFDLRGNMVRVFGELPPGDDDVPPNVRQHAFQGALEVSPDRTRLVLASRHADRIEVYDLDGRSVVRAERPFDFDPVYEADARGGRPVMVTGDDLRFGYIDVAVTSDRIYALFSGRTRRGFPGEANFGEYVHVFDWSGALRTVFKLDASALAIAADEETSTLYVVRHLPEPAVVRYAAGGVPVPRDAASMGSLAANH